MTVTHQHFKTLLPALEKSLAFFRPHHEELRKRLCFIIGSIILFTLIAYCFAEKLTVLCIAPLLKSSPLIGKLVYTNLPEAFIAYLKIALFTGIICSMPVTLYQCWAFVAPGLHKNEKQTALTITFWASLLFVAGAGFAFFIALPQLLVYFMSYADAGLVPLPKFGAYLNFTAKFTLSCGLAFEIPFFMVVAKRTGVMNSDFFRRKRIWCYGIIITVAFFLSSGDVAATLLLALPLFLLYEMGRIGMRYF